MSERPVNLNRARKARAQAAKKTRAAENAVRFGRTKARKTEEETAAARARARLDAHRRDEE